MNVPLPIVLRCADRLLPKARYTLETLLLAADIPVTYADTPPASGPWLYYGAASTIDWPFDRCVALAHCPEIWRLFEGSRDVDCAVRREGLDLALADTLADLDGAPGTSFDLIANAFYFLSSWSERHAASRSDSRQLHACSVYSRLGFPQDIVDRYLARLKSDYAALCDRLGLPSHASPAWPGGARYALVLSHDVDFVAERKLDTLVQGGKTLLRHLVRRRSPGDAFRAGAGLVKALAAGRDPYGCVPEIIDAEKRLGVRSSFQVAVARHHPNDVNYDVHNDRTRDYLKIIAEAGFDLCLHGSYTSTNTRDRYADEVALLSQRLGRPTGSRQHYLSFDYDALFRAQERCGIEYDMSMGFPDRIGARAGFSHPYFPYCLEEDRPYDVVELSLFFMDVTLSGYMNLDSAQALALMHEHLDALRETGGCVSAVWHPIVFGGARDPGYDRLYFQIIDRIRDTGGLATDGKTINAAFRARARAYPSFAMRR